MITEQKKREIEVLLAEYRQSVEDYHAWMMAWKQRNSGLRCLRETPKTESRNHSALADRRYP